MKDKVFIAWSGDSSTAAAVRRALSKEDYLCFIGGNESNDVQSVGVGDAIVSQMKECNQAIVIFQNKPEGGVSQNLFFELGYVFASYGAEKVHCVRRANEVIEMPSDFDNAFVEPLDDESEEVFVDQIIKYFFKRQKMTVDENKMELINDAHNIRDLIRYHYSSQGSKCSDYELAQYILFYMQAVHMFQTEAKAMEELKRFNRDHYSRFSRELALSLEFAAGYLELVSQLEKDDGEVYVSYEAFDEFDKICSHVTRTADEDNVGDFYLWFRMFVYETWNFAYVLIGENPNETEEDRIGSFREALRLAEESFRILDQLEENETVKRVNDAVGILALIRSYLCRNQFVTIRDLGALTGESGCEEDSVRWLMRAKEIRAEMIEFYKGALDTNLYEHLSMEYYLISCECMKYAAAYIDNRERRSLRNGIVKFLDHLEDQNRRSYVYIEQIRSMFDQI